MKLFFNVPTDLYIHKNDLSRMEQGESAIGHKELSDSTDYELISRHAFQEIRKEDVLGTNGYNVVFIFK